MDDNKQTIDIPGMDMPYQLNNSIKAIRKNPKRALSLMKRKTYFQENNHEEAVLNALKRGVGRTARRNLARKMMVSWSEFLEMEDIIVEEYSYLLPKASKLAWFERKNGLFREKKITNRKYQIAKLIALENMTLDEAEASV